MLSALPIGLSAALALVAQPPAANGDTVAIRVEFDGPAGCSSADAFYAGLLTRMSRSRRAAPGEDAVRLGVRLTRAGGKVRGELRLMDGPGDGDTRRVEGESCDAVVEVLSLTAALALTTQPLRPTPPPPPRVPPPPRPPATPPETKPPEPPPEPPPEAPKPDTDKTTVEEKRPPPPPEVVRGSRFQLGVQAVAADVISSSVNVGGGITARFERHADGRPRASLGLTFLYAPNDVLETADDVLVRWTAVALTGCPPWSLGRILTVQACAQAIGGWLTATGVGLTNPRSVGRSWWSAGALLRLGAHMGGFSLELEAGATIPLVGRTFISTTPDRTVGETPTIAPMLALGLSRAL